MSGIVRLKGWNGWKKPEAHTTACYEEFNSTDAGASPTNRLAWTKLLSEAEANKINVKNVFGGWSP